jgi:guanine deaminase
VSSAFEQQQMFMRRAIELSAQSLTYKKGGPFGAVIVQKGVVVAEGVNEVTSSCDPTAHAEIQAIRAAAQKLGTFDLSGCEIYSSCEPCPMCLGAIYWSRIRQVFFANDRQDAAAIGFDDAFIYDEMKLDFDQRKLSMVKIASDDAREIFGLWHGSEGQIRY